MSRFAWRAAAIFLWVRISRWFVNATKKVAANVALFGVWLMGLDMFAHVCAYVLLSK